MVAVLELELKFASYIHIVRIVSSVSARELKCPSSAWLEIFIARLARAGKLQLELISTVSHWLKVIVMHIVHRVWSPKFETGLNFIIKSALYSIFWQYWITDDLNNSFQCFKTSFFLLNHSNQYQLLFWFRIQVFDPNFQWIQTF